jgi:hypothetical protein
VSFPLLEYMAHIPSFPDSAEWVAYLADAADIRAQKERLDKSQKLLEELQNVELPSTTPRVTGG